MPPGGFEPPTFGIEVGPDQPTKNHRLAKCRLLQGFPASAAGCSSPDEAAFLHSWRISWRTFGERAVALFQEASQPVPIPTVPSSWTRIRSVSSVAKITAREAVGHLLHAGGLRRHSRRGGFLRRQVAPHLVAIVVIHRALGAMEILALRKRTGIRTSQVARHERRGRCGGC